MLLSLCSFDMSHIFVFEVGECCGRQLHWAPLTSSLVAMNRFLCIKLIDSNVKTIGFNEQFLLHGTGNNVETQVRERFL